MILMRNLRSMSIYSNKTVSAQNLMRILNAQRVIVHAEVGKAQVTHKKKLFKEA